MDPATAGLIAVGIGQLVTLFLQIHSSIKSRHFKSYCGKCGVEYSSEHIHKEADKEENTQPTININIDKPTE